MARFGFCGPSYTDLSLVVAGEKSMNLYPIPIASLQPGRARYMLRKTPGMRVFTSDMRGPVTKIFYQDGRGFCVAGDGFYEFFTNGANILRGMLSAGDPRPASIVSNGSAGNQLFIVTSGYGYIYNLVTNTLTQITDVDFPNPCTVGAISDAYFVALQTGSTQFAISALFDGLTWDPLDVAQKSQTHDNIQSLIWAQKALWLIGSKNTEVWVDTGDPDFPFAPLQGVAIPHGTGAIHSVAELGSLMWIGADESGGRVVWQMQGYQPVRISNYGMEHILKSYTTVDDAIGFVQQLGGHVLYWLYFPIANATWVYDTEVGHWHERSKWDTTQARDTAHLARTHAFAFDRNLVGSRRDGTIYEMSEVLYDDAGETMRWLRRSPYVHIQGRRTFFKRISWDMEVGVGLTTGDGSNPLMMYRQSMDAGKTYTNERHLSLGLRGEWLTQVETRRLGSSVKPVLFEVSGVDPVPITFVDADVEVA